MVGAVVMFTTWSNISSCQAEARRVAAQEARETMAKAVRTLGLPIDIDPGKALLDETLAGVIRRGQEARDAVQVDGLDIDQPAARVKHSFRQQGRGRVARFPGADRRCHRSIDVVLDGHTPGVLAVPEVGDALNVRDASSWSASDNSHISAFRNSTVALNDSLTRPTRSARARCGHCDPGTDDPRGKGWFGQGVEQALDIVLIGQVRMGREVPQPSRTAGGFR